MTTIQEALTEFPTGRLQSLAKASLSTRDACASSDDRAWAALNNALLCAATDELASRRRAETELFEHLADSGNPFTIVSIIRP